MTNENILARIKELRSSVYNHTSKNWVIHEVRLEGMREMLEAVEQKASKYVIYKVPKGAASVHAGKFTKFIDYEEFKKELAHLRETIHGK